MFMLYNVPATSEGNGLKRRKVVVALPIRIDFVAPRLKHCFVNFLIHFGHSYPQGWSEIAAV